MSKTMRTVRLMTSGKTSGLHLGSILNRRSLPKTGAVQSRSVGVLWSVYRRVREKPGPSAARNG